MSETRGPGRPPKSEKKGTKSWQPSNLGDVLNKEPGYRYRWARKDEDNIQKKLEEGWEFVSGVNDPKPKAVYPDGRPDEPHELTSNVTRRDGILMRMDEETAQRRDDYFNQRTATLERRLGPETRKDLAKEGAPMHGSIIRERQGIKTDIE